MIHYMKLQPHYFKMIKKGIKNIEMRLYDEKRKMVNIGDEIEFLNIETGEILITRVIKLHLFENFEVLYNHFDKEKLGYDKDEIAKASDMSKYYSEEEILKYGVVGIEIEVIDA